jgi:hypothetical protein
MSYVESVLNENINRVYWPLKSFDLFKYLMQFIRNLDLVVSIVTDLRVGLYGVRITTYQVVFTFFKTPTPAVAPTHPPAQWVTLAVLPRVKW